MAHESGSRGACERFSRLFLEPVTSECDLFALALYRITREGLVRLAVAGEGGEGAAARLPLEGFPASTAARKGVRRLVNEVEASDAAVTGGVAELVEPVLFEGLPVGALVAASAEPHGVGDWAVQMTSLLAKRLAPVLAWRDEAAALAAAEAVDGLAERFAGRFDWTGVYAQADSEWLQLVAFVGEPTVHVRIPVAAGLCGAAVRENAVQNVADVRCDSRYLACSLRTRSELVVPVRDAGGAAVAEIDIDSDRPGRFSPELVAAVEAAAAGLSARFGRT